MNGEVFYVTLKLEDVGAQMASLETTTERGEWFEGFHVGIHGHKAREHWSGVKMQGYEFGVVVLGEAIENKGKFSKAGKASADARKAAKGTAQPERRSNDVETTFTKRSEHSSKNLLTTNHQPLPTTQDLRPKKSFLAEAEAIYAAYPLKKARGPAIKAIEKALKAKPYTELLEAVQAYGAAVSRWDDRDKTYIPHPASWFNAERWSDDRSTWEKKSPKTNNNLTRSFDPSYYEEK